jgi:hypothetical protein
VAAVDQYNEIRTTGGYFRTDDVRWQSVFTQMFDVDPSEFWRREYDKGILPLSYNSPDGVKHGLELRIRSVQEIDTPRSDLVPHRQSFQCPL